MQKHYFTQYTVQVKQKTEELLITQIDAIFEVYTDRFVNEQQSCDKVLLWIFGQNMSEFSVSSSTIATYIV